MDERRKQKDSFVFYFDWMDHLSLLEPSEALGVLNTLRDYITTGEVHQELSSAAKMAFSFIKSQVDRDLAKWETTRKKRSEAGKAGAEATNSRWKDSANAAFDESSPANSAVNVPVPVPVNVPVHNSVCNNKADKPPTHSRPEKKRFVPPTVEQVAEYVKQRGSKVDPQGFIDFYASKGWMIGKTPMKDWKAACRNAEHWERWEKKSVDTRNTLKTAADYDRGEDFFSC